jgi:folate-dependent phosphoribosylglycinamide formyltransferase PurN
MYTSTSFRITSVNSTLVCIKCSNLQSIIDNADNIGVNIQSVISNKADAFGLQRAKNAHKTKDRVTRTPLKTGGELNYHTITIMMAPCPV